MQYEMELPPQYYCHLTRILCQSSYGRVAGHSDHVSTLISAERICRPNELRRLALLASIRLRRPDSCWRLGGAVSSILRRLHVNGGFLFKPKGSRECVTETSL